MDSQPLLLSTHVHTHSHTHTHTHTHTYTHTHRCPPLASTLSTPTISRNNSLNSCDQQQTPNTLNYPSIYPNLPSKTVSGPTPSLSPPPTRIPSTLIDGPINFLPQFSPRKQAVGRQTRQYFGQNSGYIMDAKTKGNVGRYINVS